MDKKQYLGESKNSFKDDQDIIPDEENTSRRSGMRFSTVQEFLDSLNTATTEVEAVKGLQKMSLVCYHKCMQGHMNDNDEGKGDAESKRQSDEAQVDDPEN